MFEVELQHRVCHGLLSQAGAQREVADDWTATYAHYVGGVPVAAPGSSGPVMGRTPARLGITARMKAEALRLTRWILAE